MRLEDQLVSELATHVATRLRAEGIGLYTAMRIMGYVTVALAEALDIVGPGEEQEYGVPHDS